MIGSLDLGKSTLFLIQETDLGLEKTPGLAEQSQLEQNAVGSVFSPHPGSRDVTEGGPASRPTPIQDSGSNTQIQQEHLHASKEALAFRCERHPYSTRIWVQAHRAVGGEKALQKSNYRFTRSREHRSRHFLLRGVRGSYAKPLEEFDEDREW